MSCESRASKRQYWIVEYRNGEPILVHHIVNPSLSERGWYVHVLSTDGFQNRESTRLLKAERICGTPQRYFSVRRNSEWEFDRHRPLYGLSELPIEERGTIFDFYKHVGFDHKKNRYVERTPECPTAMQ